MKSTLNLADLAAHFSDEDAARALLEETRWGKDCQSAACPHCGAMNPYRLTAKAEVQSFAPRY